MVQYSYVCKEPCVVEIDDFVPRGCLRTATWQEWEKIEEGEAEK